MEISLDILISLGTIIAIVLSIISFFSSKKKDQSELDKKQDLNIGILQEKQAAFDQRISKLEGQHDILDSKMAKEMEKVYNKIDALDQFIRNKLIK